MDVTEKYLVPLPGLCLRDPITKTMLPEGGAIVMWIGSEGRYWRRRVADGTCSIGSPAEVKPVPIVEEAKFAKENEAIKKGR